MNWPATGGAGTATAAVWHESEPVHTMVEYRVIRTPPDVFDRWNVELRVSEPELGRFEVVSSDPSILEVVVRAT